MIYLVDSDGVIDYLKGRLDAVALLERLAPDGIAVSVVTVGEVYEGIRYGRMPQRYGGAFDRWLETVEVLVLDLPIARLFGVIRGELRQRGESLKDSDLWIAATALHHDLILVTRDVGHVQRVADLKLFASS